MGRSIYLTIGGGVLEPKNVICDRMLNPVLCILYIDIVDLPKISSPAAISLQNEIMSAKSKLCRDIDVSMEEADFDL